MAMDNSTAIKTDYNPATARILRVVSFEFLTFFLLVQKEPKKTPRTPTSIRIFRARRSLQGHPNCGSRSSWTPAAPFALCIFESKKIVVLNIFSGARAQSSRS